ncbi:MAG: GntR family transcriptional regulator [Candidatus Ventricola sp.]
MITSKKTTLKDQVYQQIIEMICNGQIQTGEIVTEKQLIEHFGFSKSPVREALIQLCHDGVLHSIPRCGYQVIQISAKDVRDLTELRIYLELGSLRRLIVNLTENHLEQLRELNRQRNKPAQEKDLWTAWDNNVQFHLCLMEGTGNALALDVLRRTLSTCTRAYAQLYFTRRDSVISPRQTRHLHERIVNALESRDLDTALKLLREDILCMQTELLPNDNF